MAKIGGGGPKAPDTSGVARAHESVMQSHRDNAQQAAQMGQAVGGVVDDVRQQGQIDAEKQARKDRLDVEMAKGDLEFKGEGADRKVVTTEAGQAAAAKASQRADIEASSKAQRAAAYELSQRMAVIKAGYTVDGELNEGGRTALKNLGAEYKKTQKQFSRAANGDQRALQELAREIPDPRDPGSFGDMMVDADGAPLEMGGAGMGAVDMDPGKAGTDPTHAQAGPDPARIMPAVRAKLDHQQMKFVVNSGGEMPDDVMMDSKAWQQFNGARNNFIAIARSGVMMPPTFSNIKERNRFFNELAAKQVLSGQPLPGSMADPSLTEGLPPSAGQPDDGTQPTQQQSSPGTTSTTESGPGGYGFTTHLPNSGR